MAPLPEVPRAWAIGHDVQFYDSEEYLAQSVATFLVDGVRAGQPFIVIATASHRRAFAEQLGRMGVDLEDYLHGPDHVWLDARDTLAAFMERGVPNAELFDATVGTIFDKLHRNRPYLVTRAYGEMVDLLWKDGNVEGAIALEELWNQLALKYSFSLLCAYSMGNFYKEAHTEGFRRICDHHSRVLPTEAYMQATEPERLRQITHLQQRARVLEAEVAHRREVETALRDVLNHRRRVEDALRSSEAQMRDFLENAVEPMHSVGADGTVLWVNRAELELLGYERHEVVGHHIAEFHADANVISDILERLSRNEVLVNHPATLVRKDGSPRRVLINSSALFEDGKFRHTRCFTRDVTALPDAWRFVAREEMRSAQL